MKKIGNKTGWLMAMLALVLGFVGSAQAATNVTQILDDGNTLFGSVQNFVIGVVAFFFLVKIVLWARKAR